VTKSGYPRKKLVKKITFIWSEICIERKDSMNQNTIQLYSKEMKKSLVSFFIASVFSFASNLYAQDTLETRQLEMKHCVQLYHSRSVVILRRGELDSLIRNDANRDFCVDMLKDFDLDHFSLLGIDINSGYCRIPSGLTYSVVQLKDEKKYLFEISYDEPSTPCRAFSSYHLWLQVPKLPDGYEVEFVVRAEEM